MEAKNWVAFWARRKGVFANVGRKCQTHECGVQKELEKAKAHVHILVAKGSPLPTTKPY